jgi:plasmid stabilization system protein ParE
MKLRFTPRAVENIVAIADYIRERNPAASQRVRAAIYESLQDLILFPHVGRPQRTEGVKAANYGATACRIGGVGVEFCVNSSEAQLALAFSPALSLCILMFAPLRRVLDVENDDLLDGIIHNVVNEVGGFLRGLPGDSCF